MTDHERIEQLEKRLQFMTNTMINIQVELQKLREQISGVPAATAEEKTVVAGEVKPVTLPAAKETVTPVEAVTGEIKTAPPPVIPPPPPTAPKPAKKQNIEAFIGGKLITIIGISILVLGLGFFVKYAIDNDMIGPVGRVALGLLAGAALVGIAFRLKTNYKAFSAVLLSGGMATLYFSVYAAFSFYGLIPREMAFAVMVALTAFTVFAAVMYDLEIIGIIGLVGAYAVPALLSDRSGRVLILLSYMSVVNIGILVLAFRKNWKILTQFAMYLSWAIFLGWFSNRYEFDKHFPIATGFSSLFFVLFYLMTVGFKLVRKFKFGVNDVIMLTINSFLYYGVCYRIFDDIHSGAFHGLMTVGMALIHVLFSMYTYKTSLADKRFFFLQIGMALTFLVIAVPVQLSGSWVTMVWSIGALLLYWIGRTQKVSFYEKLSYALIVLSLFSMFNDWAEALTYREALRYWDPVINITFLTSALYLLSLTGMLILAYRKKYLYDPVANSAVTLIANYGMIVILIVMTYSVFYREIYHYFGKLFELSAVKTAGEFSYTLYDYDYDHFRFLWLFNFTAFYLSLFSFLVIRKWKHRVLQIASFVLNFFTAIVFLFGVIYVLGELRTLYMMNLNAEYYVQGPFYIAIRYICYVFAAVLLYFSWRLLKEMYPALVKYFNLFIHITVLTALSAELTTWMILANDKESMNEIDDLSRRVWYSVLWGIYSLVLIAYGILKKVKYLRISAIVLFGITLFKVVFFDLYDISTGGKIIVFICLGILLLIIAFLYQKFKTIIFGDDENEKHD